MGFCCAEFHEALLNCLSPRHSASPSKCLESYVKRPGDSTIALPRWVHHVISFSERTASSVPFARRCSTKPPRGQQFSTGILISQSCTIEASCASAVSFATGRSSPRRGYQASPLNIERCKLNPIAQTRSVITDPNLLSS